MVDNGSPAIGSTVTFTIVVSNLEGDTAKNVQLTDSISTCLTDVAIVSGYPFYSDATGGSASLSGNLITWDLADLDTTEVSDTLKFTAKVACEGVYFSKAEITTPVGENDVDADPSNYNYGEDDIATACVSVPIQLCVTNNDTLELEAISGTTDVQWYRVYDVDGSGGLTVGDTVPHGSLGSNTAIVDLPCLLYTSPSPRDQRGSRMPSSA